MNLKKLLVLAFTSIIAFTVTVFALISYNLSSDIAIKQRAEFLQHLTQEEAKRLGMQLIPEAMADRRVIAGMLDYRDGQGSVNVVADKNGIVASSLAPAVLQEKLSLKERQLRELLASESDKGHFSIDGRLYVWARASIADSGLRLLNIHFDIGSISTAMSTLTTRLIVISLVIVWLASWAVLIFATVISQRLQQKNIELEYRSVHDELTDLGNRNFLQSTLNAIISSDRLQQKRAAILIVDIDRFKEINNTLGHHAGDAILEGVAERLLKALRSSDVVTRFGSDEFAVIAMIDDVEDSHSVANKIIAAMATPFEVSGQMLNIDVSMGIALYPKHGFDATTLMRHADVAMYQAKDRADNYVVYNRSFDPHSKRKLELINQLKSAIANGQMHLYYQPKFNLNSSEFDAVEVLLRWHHPTKGVIPASDIIPLAEQIGVMQSISNWVLDSALKFCSEQRKQGRYINVSINLSAQDMEDTNLAEKVAKLLAQYHVEAKMLTLEITESVLITANKRVVSLFHKLSELGVQIAIDHFGTGYTSLSFLNRLAVNEIKIDSSFVTAIDKQNNETMVRSIIDLSHSMSYRVVAEGVETIAVLEKLRELKCDAVQGYYLSYPMDESELVAWLDDSTKEIIKYALT